MKPLFHALLRSALPAVLFLALGLRLAAATLTGSFKNPDGTGSTNVVRFTPRSTPLADDDDLVVTRDVLATPAADGTFSVTLRAGAYNVSPVTTRPFVIDVPDNTNTYTLNSRITTALPAFTSGIPSTNAVPLATATVSGKVRTDATSTNPVVYLKESVDDLLADLEDAIAAVSTDNFLAVTNATAVRLSGSLTNVTANGIALTAHGISAAVNQTAGDLQDLGSMGILSAAVPSRMRVLRDNSGYILGSGRFYTKFPADTRPSDGITIILPIDVASDASPGRWVLEGYEP